MVFCAGTDRAEKHGSYIFATASESDGLSALSGEIEQVTEKGWLKRD